MSHRNARLTFHGRRLLVQRVRDRGHAGRACRASDGDLASVRASLGRPVRRRGRGRPCAIGRRGRIGCRPGPAPRSRRWCSRLGVEHRRGPDWLGPELGVPARTVSRILRRHHVPRLAVCDPMTGEVIRASKTTAVRYERDRPGELVHMDVKKIGRIPDGGGWRAHGRRWAGPHAQKKARIGFDYVHSVVDDHSRFAYSEILPDETGRDLRRVLRPRARLLRRPRHHRRRGHDRQPLELHARLDARRRCSTVDGIKHTLIKPHCPWQNGKVERFNRTLQTEWAYRQVFTSNDERTAALAPWLDDYNTRRRHSALGGHPPISRLSPT